MSFYIVDAILEWDRYKNPTKAVLVALCSCINEERYQASGNTEVWPGTKKLMHLSGCSYNTVRRCVERLEQDGVVTILSEGVGTETAHYLIHVAHIPQSCFIKSYLERTHTSGPDDSPELPEVNHGESRLIQGNGGGTGEGTPVGAERVHVPPERAHGMTGEGAGVYPERSPNKELNNEFNMERKSKVTYNSPSARDLRESAFSDDPPEVELTPAEEEFRDEMYEFAKEHKFWKKFTRPPLSRFIKGCVESETFQKQFLKFKKARKKTSSKVPSAPLFDTSDLDY
jgi:hypothetical protein